MKSKNKERLTAAQIKGLLISVGEARKLLGADYNDMSDDEVARKIILLSDLGRVVMRTLCLQ